MGWRYIAQRLTGDGTNNQFIDVDLPLADVSITSTLSGPGELHGTIPVEIMRLKDAFGRPLLDEWGCAIWAEADGEIRGGGILVDTQFNGPECELDCMGFSGYIHGMPFLDEYTGVQVDPLDVARMMWNHVQSQPGGNLGLILDSTTSPIRIGDELENVESTTGSGEEVAFEAGPYKLNWWSTDDLGREFDDLAKSTPFDYIEQTRWSDDRTSLEHRLRLGHPTLGRRRTDLRFVVGENIATVPNVQRRGDDYADTVQVLGAGEGRDMIRATVSADRGQRLRRVAVVADKGATSQQKATSVGRSELNARYNASTVSEVMVRDHPHAPIGSWAVGDEIRLQGSLGWIDLDTWVRITSSTISPDSGDAATLTVANSVVM